MNNRIWIEKRYQDISTPATTLSSGKFTKNNRKKNSMMENMSVGDHVVHLYMDKKNINFVGVSIINKIENDDLRYNCTVKDFTKFDSFIEVYNDFLKVKKYENILKSLHNKEFGGHLFFDKNLSLLQGIYFCNCPILLAELINDAYLAKNPQAHKLPLINIKLESIKENIIENKINELSVDKILDDTFFSKEKFLEIIDTLKSEKNIIIEGPPGVGKTFIAKKIADYFCNKDISKQSRLVFHENYSYEEFIMGIRPDETGNFTLAEGQFLKLCKKAQGDLDSKYVILIDEINRANITRVFGEILVCIENDKRGPDNSVKLLYSPEEDFYIPENVHIIGLMNTADKSLKALDFALRRRFSFFTFKPEYGDTKFKNFLENKKVNKDIINRIISRMSDLNNKIKEDDLNLGKGYCVGHSFFCPSNEEQKLDEEWYKRIVKYKINPLLEEYFKGEESKTISQFKSILLP